MKLLQRREEPDWIRKLREQALAEFEKLEKPLFKYGISLYTNLKELDLDSINPKNNEIVVKASKEANILSAEDSGLKFVKEFFMQRAYYSGENKMTALHCAFWNDALVVQVPDNTIVKEPVVLKFDSDNDWITHVLIIAGENSKVKINEIHTGKGFRSHGVEVFGAQGSDIKHESIQDLEGWHFEIKRAVISKDARMEWFTGSFGGRLSKIEVSTDLAGEGARTLNKGIFIGKDEQRFDIYNTSIHSAPNTYSDMINKGVVFDKSKSIYRGLIKIKESAKNCDGYQKQDTLILSDEAEADAIPNLEINNNQVKCSHGATIGQVDEEDIFYLMSRGLSKKESIRQIVLGFLGSMTESEELKEFIEGKLR